MLEISNVIIARMPADQWIRHILLSPAVRWILSPAATALLPGLLNFGLLRKYANSSFKYAIIKTIVITAVQYVLVWVCFVFIYLCQVGSDFPLFIFELGYCFAFIVISSVVTFSVFAPTKREGGKDLVRGYVLALVSALAWVGILFAWRGLMRFI